MTAAAPNERAIRIPPLLHWLLSGIATGVSFLVASPLLPDWWRLGIGCVNAVLVFLAARSQPRETPEQVAARAAGKPSVPPMASTVLLLVVLSMLFSGCFSLWHSPEPDAIAAGEVCPVGKVCEEEPARPSQEECESISAWHTVFVISAGVFGGVATAGAAVVPFLDGHPDAIAGVGGAAAASGALGITAGSLAAWEADRFTRLGCEGSP